jgi:hypothetical protein
MENSDLEPDEQLRGAVLRPQTNTSCPAASKLRSAFPPAQPGGEAAGCQSIKRKPIRRELNEPGGNA